MFARLCADWRSGAPEVTSAGFIGPNRPPPPDALLAAERKGVDISAHRSSVFTPRDISSVDLVVVMAAEQARALRRRFRRRASTMLVLGDLDPRIPRTRTIVDPWGQPADVFDASYARISRCVQELARLLAQRNGLPPIVGTTDD
jgi:protein-tyrosine-phosphatase